MSAPQRLCRGTDARSDLAGPAAVSSVWAELDNFLALDGHSLLVVQVVERLRQVWTAGKRASTSS